SVNLVAGANTITVVATDNNSNTATEVVTVTYNPPDTTAPILSISQPADGQVFTTSPVLRTGAPWVASGILTVTVNGHLASGTANWSSSVTLAVVVNTITVVATDNSPATNTSTQSVTVTYNPPDTTAPILSISQPADGQVFTTSPVL